MNILVTGAAGFIGSHVAEALVARGHHIIGVDLHSNVIPEGITFVQCNLFDAEFETIFKQQKIDVICHQAGKISVSESMLDPHADANTNILGTLKMLMLAKKYNVPRFVFASSAAVYGDTPILPCRESYVLEPKSPYGLSKLTAEKYVLLLAKNPLVLRYGNVYGPRQNPASGVIAKFVEAFKNKQSITIHGDGLQTRDFVFVKDVALMNAFAVENNVTGVFNIGTGKPTTINKVVCILENTFGYLPSCAYTTLPSENIEHMVLDCTRLKEEFKCGCSVDIEEGINHMVRGIL